MKGKNSFQLHFIIKQIHYITIFRDIELKNANENRLYDKCRNPLYQGF